MDKEKTLRKLKQEIEEVREKFGVEFAEVVRCKDCWKSDEGLCSYKLKDVPGKDFCGDGERRTDDEN